MKINEMISTAALTGRKSIRPDNLRGATSMKAGKIVPVAFVPLLREDRVGRGRIRLAVEMAETVQTLMNAVNVTAHAYFVPTLAMERFEGSLDQLNRSYKGEPQTEGGDVVPFINRRDREYPNEILETLGAHVNHNQKYNGDLIESYNAIVNYRRKARSTKLPLREAMDTTLAEAFWLHNNFAHIVPDYDQAAIDGEIRLDVEAANLPVRGIGVPLGADVSDSNPTSVRESIYEVGQSTTFDEHFKASDGNAVLIDADRDGGYAFPRIFAELKEQGVTLTLSNIELAKKTAAFANIRKRYSGLDDDAIIDLLMDGIRVPDAAMAQPILLDRKSTLIGYHKRYATDAGNLDKSVTTGETFLDLIIRTPAMNTGGVIMITMEIVPEQMFERTKDYWLLAETVDDFPATMRDELDPHKVAVVANEHVDVLHSDPQGTFGYAPLNHQWRRNIVRVGGKFHRQSGDPFNEDRQRIWEVETLNPQLTEDFYLTNNLHHEVFADTESDPFEVTVRGPVEIVGNTVFGQRLYEDTGDYEKLLETAGSPLPEGETGDNDGDQGDPTGGGGGA